MLRRNAPKFLATAGLREKVDAILIAQQNLRAHIG
jgi:hypothetical protein